MTITIHPTKLIAALSVYPNETAKAGSEPANTIPANINPSRIEVTFVLPK